MQRRLHDLLADEHGYIPAGMQGIYQALATVERPATAASWLDSSTAPAVLRDLRAGRQSLSHQALDELPAGKALEHLCSVLVATGILPPRDEQLTRLERWIARAIAGRSDPSQQQLLHRYAIWHVVRRLRSRLDGAHATYSQAVAARRNIKAAAVLLDWLIARGLTLATARQADLDAWLSSEHATYRADAGNFIRWARNWLFPGGQPSQPISAYQLAGRLRQLGIRSGQSRSAALFQLATDLPAAILARLLGIHISVAVAWQRAAAGDWAAYAADISHRLEH